MTVRMMASGDVLGQTGRKQLLGLPCLLSILLLRHLSCIFNIILISPGWVSFLNWHHLPMKVKVKIEDRIPPFDEKTQKSATGCKLV